MHEKVELSGITKQIMPGPSGDLKEWQTLEVNVTIGFARHYLYNIRCFHTLGCPYCFLILVYCVYNIQISVKQVLNFIKHV